MIQIQTNSTRMKPDEDDTVEEAAEAEGGGEEAKRVICSFSSFSLLFLFTSFDPLLVSFEGNTSA